MLHLVDTDGVIDQLKGFRPTIELLLQLSGQGHTFCTSPIVIAEMYAGLAVGEYARAEQLLSTLIMLPPSPESARQAGSWKYQYARQGRQLAITDCLNAAVAFEHLARVLTRNVADY